MGTGMSSLSLEPHLIEVEFYVALFSNTAPSGFHSVRFSSLTGNFSPPPSTQCLLHIEDLELCLHSSDLNGLFTQLGYAH